MRALGTRSHSDSSSSDVKLPCLAYLGIWASNLKPYPRPPGESSVCHLSFRR